MATTIKATWRGSSSRVLTEWDSGKELGHVGPTTKRNGRFVAVIYGRPQTKYGPFEDAGKACGFLLKELRRRGTKVEIS